MNKKDTIAFDWLKRYTGTEPGDYGGLDSPHKFSKLCRQVFKKVRCEN